jgi:hypothetical protein
MIARMKVVFERQIMIRPEDRINFETSCADFARKAKKAFPPLTTMLVETGFDDEKPQARLYKSKFEEWREKQIEKEQKARNRITKR